MYFIHNPQKDDDLFHNCIIWFRVVGLVALKRDKTIPKVMSIHEMMQTSINGRHLKHLDHCNCLKISSYVITTSGYLHLTLNQQK